MVATVSSVPTVASEGHVDRLQSEAATRFAPLLRASPVAICLSTLADGRIIDANDAFLRLFGYLPDELIGRTSLELGLFDQPNERARAVTAIREQPMQRAIDVGIVTRGGTRKRVMLWPEVVDLGGVEGLLTQIFDVAADDPIATRYLGDTETAALLSTVFAAAAEGIVVQDASGRIVLANPAAERILGLSSAQLEGRTARDSVWHATREDGTPISPEHHPSSITLRTGLPQTDVVMSVTIGEGEPVWVSVTTRPVRLPESDAPNGVVASFFDITERKRLEATVREGDERLRSILDLTGVGTWTLDVQT
ncbi:MAG: PAS domain-containing protein, partial [Thermomicrobiales bacterium]|nr:PAS domain-containing protein [Thermomicrobiales bacterium]